MCNAITNLDGEPDELKGSCPVLTGGKVGDNIKGLPIGIAPVPLNMVPSRFGEEDNKYNIFKILKTNQSNA